VHCNAFTNFHAGLLDFQRRVAVVIVEAKQFGIRSRREQQTDQDGIGKVAHYFATGYHEVPILRRRR
jgi:hypothetical protein